MLEALSFLINLQFQNNRMHRDDEGQVITKKDIKKLQQEAKNIVSDLTILLHTLASFDNQCDAILGRKQCISKTQEIREQIRRNLNLVKRRST